jgi:hypothetical protein
MACYRDSFTFTLVKHHDAKTYGGGEVYYSTIITALDGCDCQIYEPAILP